MKDFAFINRWKKEMIQKLQLVHPNWDSDKLDDYLDKVIEKKFKDKPCKIVNSYRGKEIDTTLLNTLQYIHDHNPVLGGYGVMYRNHHEVYNPSAHMLMESINLRKDLKKQRKNYDKRSYEFLMLDIGQGNEKVIANSFYGANGNAASTFFNRDIASSITAIGQAEIATAETSFEAFMSNNTPFYDMDDCLLFISRVLNETEFKYDIEPMHGVREALLGRLCGMFQHEKDIDHDKLHQVVFMMSFDQATKVYFKNNLEEFCAYHKPTAKLLKKLINTTKSFRNPYDIPEEIKGDLDQLWEYIKCFVVHNFPVRNRIDRNIYHKRKTCVVQDTDSTMLTLASFMRFMTDEFADDEVAAETEDDFRFILVNITCHILTEYSKLFLGRYCTDVNIPEDHHWMINMKNEFYYPILLDTKSKKSYITLTKLQEGQEISPPKIEIHGMTLTKSETPDATKNFLMGIIKDDIMYADRINVAQIVRKLKQFEKLIRDSLMKGSPEFLALMSVKEVEAYDRPYSEAGVKAVRNWNFLNTDMQIQLPDKILGLPLITDKEKIFESMRGELPEDKWQTISNNIWKSGDKDVARAGFDIIAIPQNLERIPEWLAPIINYDKVVDDNVKKFNIVMHSLGNVNLQTRSQNEYMSNIISF